MEQVGTDEASRTVDMAQESQNERRDGSSNGGEDTSLHSKSEKPFPEESKKSSNEIAVQGSSSSNNSTVPKVPKIPESKPPSNVHGFENEKLHLQRLLSNRGKDGDHHFNAIGVVGIPGVGKTTLCQSIFHSQVVKSQFVPRIWVSMSRHQNDDDLKIEAVTRMLERLGVYEETISSFQKSHGLNGLRYILHQQLIGKRYLIVLDGLQLQDSGEEWREHLSNMLPKGYGGLVIVTSRNEDFIKKMVGDENVHQLHPLSDQESCWLIYRDSVRDRANDEELNLQIRNELEKELENLQHQNKHLAKMIEERKLKFRDSEHALELNLQSAKEFEEELKKLEEQKLPDTKPIEEKRAKQREQKKNAEQLKRKCGGLPLAAKMLGEVKAEEELKRKSELLLGDIQAVITRYGGRQRAAIREHDAQTAPIQQTAVNMNA